MRFTIPVALIVIAVLFQHDTYSQKSFLIEGKIALYNAEENSSYIKFRTYGLLGRHRDTSIKINKNGSFKVVLSQAFNGDIALMYRNGFVVLYMTQSEKMIITIDDRKYIPENIFDIAALTFHGKTAETTRHINNFLRKKERYKFNFEVPWYDKNLTDYEVAELAMRRISLEQEFAKNYVSTNKINKSDFKSWALNEVTYSIARTLCFESTTTTRHKNLTIEELFKVLKSVKIENQSALNNSSYYHFLGNLLNCIQVFTNINPIYSEQLKENGNNETLQCMTAIDKYSSGYSKQLLYANLLIYTSANKHAPYESDFYRIIKDSLLLNTALLMNKPVKLDNFNIVIRIKDSKADDETKQKLVKLFNEKRGQHLFIDFWANWCGPCTRELPLYPALADSLRGLKIQFLFLSQTTPDSFVSAMRDKYGNVGEFINLSTNEISLLNNILKFSAIPQHFLIDSQSNLVPDVQISRIGNSQVDTKVVAKLKAKLLASQE